MWTRKWIDVSFQNVVSRIFFGNSVKIKILLLLLFFSYHQKVPYDPPELVLSDKTYGLVSPEPYEWPDRAPLWTAAAYAAFDVALDPDSKEGKAKAVKFLIFFSTFFSNSWFFFQKSDQKGDVELKPVKEVPHKTAEGDNAKNKETGCVLS